jgi:UDP-glucose 4-epimerase
MPIKIFSILEWFSKTFPHINIIQEENRLGDPQNTCANMVKTRSNLNFNKNYNFWDALENTKKWCFESKLF